MASKTAAFPGVTRVQESIRSLQAEAQKMIDGAGKKANGLLKDRRKALEQVLAQAKSLRSDLQKRTTKAIKLVETTAEATLARIEAEARKRVESLAHRLSLSSKKDVDQLAKRLSSLEKKVDDLLAAKAKA